MKTLAIHVLILTGFCLFGQVLYAQSISGNVNSGTSTKHLGYANVDIYKNGKLVANVLSDEKGNFNVRLDTGSYVCKITYAGYKPITREIKVKADEKADFSLDEDEKSKYTATEMAEVTIKADRSRSSSAKLAVGSSREYSGDTFMLADYETTVGKGKGIPSKNMWRPEEKLDSASFGKLTAGEINDFSKWELWTDLSTGVLKTNQLNWNFAPDKRYTLQLKDQNGLPLADAVVELIKGDNVVFKSRTDNTGKAELWENLQPDTNHLRALIKMRVAYRGETRMISNPKRFEEGINYLVLSVPCSQIQNVDIAFVVDATGSMQDEINYLKYDLNSVVYKSKEISSSLNFRFANIFYQDHSDRYLTSTQDFTRVLSESVAFTNRHNADGGGDYEEAVEVALDSALNRLSWSKEARARILFLVLDAPPHNTPEIRRKLINLSYKAAEMGVRIVAVTGSGTNKNTEYLMRCLALATNGTYTFLTDHSGIGNPHIKPSTDNYQVEILNDLLVRIIKSFTYMPDCSQNIAELEINLPDSIVIVNKSKDSSLTKPAGVPDSMDTLALNWKFYPNPTDGQVNIVANKDIAELYISDLSGKALQLIKNIKADEVVRIDLSEYPSGIYLIRYPLGKQWISGKIILVRQ